MSLSLDMQEKVKSAVRAAREGKAAVVDGVPAKYLLVTDGEFLEVGDRKFRVQGTMRLRVTEVRQKKAKAPAGEAATDSEGVCEDCGKTFVKSKFNPYFTKCPECRGSRKEKPQAEARSFTCSKCGESFEVSKFQPYANPDLCPRCRRNARHKAYLDRKKAQAT